MFRSFEKIYRFVLNIVFAVCTALFALGTYTIAYLLFDDPAWQIPSVIIGVIPGIIVSSYLYAILLMPYMLSKEFDIIQNKVALQEYKTVNEFQSEIADFIFNFFKYPGASICGGLLKFKNCDTYIKSIPEEPEIKESEFSIPPEKKEVYSFRFRKHTAFFIPIGLSNHDMGYMILITRGICLPFLKDILSDFENNYVDDQLLHVINQTA